MTMADVDTIRYLTHTIEKLEGMLLSQVKLKPEFEKLMTLPGIGKALAICKIKIKGRVSKPDRGLGTEPHAPIGTAGATTLS